MAVARNAMALLKLNGGSSWVASTMPIVSDELLQLKLISDRLESEKCKKGWL